MVRSLITRSISTMSWNSVASTSRFWKRAITIALDTDADVEVDELIGDIGRVLGAAREPTNRRTEVGDQRLEVGRRHLDDEVARPVDAAVVELVTDVHVGGEDARTVALRDGERVSDGGPDVRCGHDHPGGRGERLTGGQRRSRRLLDGRIAGGLGLLDCPGASRRRLADGRRVGLDRRRDLSRPTLESSSLPHAETPSPTRTIKVTPVNAVLYLPMDLRRRPTPTGSIECGSHAGARPLRESQASGENGVPALPEVRSPRVSDS